MWLIWILWISFTWLFTLLFTQPWGSELLLTLTRAVLNKNHSLLVAEKGGWTHLCAMFFQALVCGGHSEEWRVWDILIPYILVLFSVACIYIHQWYWQFPPKNYKKVLSLYTLPFWTHFSDFYIRDGFLELKLCVLDVTDSWEMFAADKVFWQLKPENHLT